MKNQIDFIFMSNFIINIIPTTTTTTTTTNTIWKLLTNHKALLAPL